MKKFRFTALLLCLFFVVSCDVFASSMTINYKVTVEIETPEGVKSGYAVRQISNSVPLLRFPDVGNPAKIRGEAVVIDLGRRGKVFFALSDQSSQNGLYLAFPVKGASTKQGIEYYRSLKLGDRGEWKSYRSPFIYFQNPKTAHSAKQLSIGEFSEVFGSGVSLYAPFAAREIRLGAKALKRAHEQGRGTPQ